MNVCFIHDMSEEGSLQVDLKLKLFYEEVYDNKTYFTIGW